MQRRSFLRTGLAAGVWSVAGGTAVAMPLLEEPRRRRPSDPIRLSSNENPLGIGPAARRAVIEALEGAHRYPQDRDALAEALARRHGVRPENIVLGAGSTELLKMAVDAFVMPQGRLVLAEPTYEDTGWYAGAGPVEIQPVPLTAAGAHDLERMRALAEGPRRPVLVYLCNPNNPTGTLTASADVDAWITAAPEDVVFVVDEAYFDYVESDRYHSALPLVRYPNVIVVRTFSKVYGMAGIRLGYAVAPAALAARLDRRHVRNNANHFALAAGLASLDDHEFVRRSLAVNARSRAIVYRCLDDLGLEYFPTHTNFVLHRINGDLQAYIARMAEHGIRVGRPFPPLLAYNRVSLGLPDEMERFAETLRGFRQRGWV